jgi:hypothetical protein
MSLMTAMESDSVAPNLQLAVEIAVRALDRNSIVALIMEIGHLDRAQVEQIANALDVYIRTGVGVAHFEHGRAAAVPRVEGKPAQSGALRVALASMRCPGAEDAVPKTPGFDADSHKHGVASPTGGCVSDSSVSAKSSDIATLRPGLLAKLNR